MLPQFAVYGQASLAGLGPQDSTVRAGFFDCLRCHTSQGFTKGVQSLTSTLGSRPLFLSLQSDLSSFKNILTVAKALRNPALRKRHWDAIRDLLGDDEDIRKDGLLLKDLKNIKRLADTPELLVRLQILQPKRQTAALISLR